MQYVQDYDEKYPFAGQYQAWGSGGHWVAGTDGGNLAISTSPFTRTVNVANVTSGALFPYIRSAQIFVCPSTEDARAKGLSYSMNCAVAGINQSSIPTTSEIVLLVDEAKTLNDGFFWAVANSISTDALTQAHLEGGNLLFIDGHVKFYGFANFPTNSANKTTQTGAPRFHDIAMGGTTGTSQAGVPQSGGGVIAGDTCPA